MTLPDAPVAIPDVVGRIAAGRPTRSVWQNEIGGHTFQIGDGPGREFVKIGPPHPEADVRVEAEKLTWAARYAPVPIVLGVGADGPLHWLHTAGIPGETAVAPRWKADIELVVRAIGKGLRALHERLPVEDCPFEWSAAARLAALPDSVRATFGDPPSIDRLVVCHGGACAPNTLVDDDGNWCGHVDLGDLGVADRWADLAVAEWSLGVDYQSRWGPVLFEAYGVEPDAERLAFYRRLWDPQS